MGVERSTLFGFGGVNRLDTYLSPEEYKGSSVSFISSVLRSRPSQWDMQFTHEATFDITNNRVDNAETMAGHYDFAFAMMHRWEMMGGDLVLRAGGMTDFYLGFAYNMHNTANNPAQAYASLSVGAAGMASYLFTLWKKRFQLDCEMRMPFVGAMFSPNYGQSYYEMFYNGNYDHNVVFTSLAVPQFRQQFTVSMPIGKRTSLAVGYLGDIRQAMPNNLKQHVYNNAFVIGFRKLLK